MKINNQDYMVLGLAGVAVFFILQKGGIKLPKLPALKALPAFGSGNLLRPTIGTSYNPADPGSYIPVSQLINGTIHDIYTGNNSGYGTPLISSIVDDVLTDTYGAQAAPGDFMRVPGAYW